MNLQGPRAAPLAAAALLVNAFVWGVSWWPFRALEGHGLHPLWSTVIVYSFCLCCLLAARLKGLGAFVSQPLLWLLAVAAGLTNVGFNWAVTVGDVVRVVLLFYLMPAWSVLLAWLLLGERPTRASLLRLALALTGLVIVLKEPGSPWPVPQGMADWLAIMGGFSFALTNILLLRLRAQPTGARMMAMFGGGALMAAAAALLGMASGSVGGVPAPAMQWVLVAAGLSVAFLVSNVALQYGAARLRASNTSVIMLSEVVFATASSVALGAAALSGRTFLGGALILLAAVLAAFAPEPRPVPGPAATSS
jgi:drug/metabolite transporter (DMT)-like permease